jgi:predicted permease
VRSLWQDVRYTWRVWRARPGLIAVAVASLALGIGANSVMFSLVDGMFLRPLPVDDPGGLVHIQWRSADNRSSAMAWPDYLALKDTGGAFADIAVQNRRGGLLDSGGEAELVLVTIVSDDFFPMLGVQAQRGRLFRADLDEALSGEPAVMVTDGLWRRRYGADPGLVGRSIRLNGRAMTVVGVLPARFQGLNRAVVTDIWIPVSTWRALGNAREFEERVVGQFEPIARLTPGATLASAQAQLDAFSQRVREEQPGNSRGRRLVALTEEEVERGSQGRIRSLLLLSITALLLLIAAANVAVLLLALADARQPEMGIRKALGAGPRRLLRQLLTESGLLALAGGFVAVLAGWWLIPVIPALLPPGPAYVRYDIRLDYRVILVTIATCTATLLLFGLVPALRGSRADLSAVMRSGVRDTRRRLGGPNLLVAAQAMLGVTLLSSAGLLGLSFARTAGIRPGFDTDRNLIMMLVSLGGPRGRIAAQSDEVAERAAGVPGVTRAAYCRRFPMASSGGGATRDVIIPGRNVPPEEQILRIRYNQISPGYLAVTGSRLLAGRAFTRADAADGQRVALVNETMARRFWPSGNAVGESIKVDAADVQIVGVVENTAINSLHEEPEPFLYLPFPQMPTSEVTFVFETAGDPVALLGSIRRELRAVAPNHAQLTTTTLRQHLKDALYQDWVPAVLSIIAAAAGMVLGAAGLFGVMVQSVTRRRRELGVRVALGARRPDLLWMVLRQGLALSGSGCLFGVGLSLAAGRMMSSLLFEVSASNPVVIGSSVCTVLLVGGLASLYPALKATRVDPVHVLRAE